MAKVTFIGAGSTVFARSVLGDILVTESLGDSEIALVDIDPQRLRDSEIMLQNINRNRNQGRARITAHLAADREAALQGADFIVFAIQVGGYEPATVIDFEIPKKYGLRQTIGDTLGIGGIFRALRTIPVINDYCKVAEKVCPDAWVINYVNPMCAITGGILRGTSMRAVGLCHSVQGCASGLCWIVGLPTDDLQWNIAGINHQGWLLDISRHGVDLYPEIKRRAELPENRRKDPVRLEIMKRFGYYVTESSEHTAEYVPWFIKRTHPHLIEEFHIPLDEYPRRCVAQIEGWARMRDELVTDKPLDHRRGHEYASYIMEAMLTGRPFTLGGNVLNTGLITNLPHRCVVEVKCVVDRSGITPTVVGDLPPQCAAVTRTNVNVHELVIEAALTGKREHVYHAAFVDPHTGAELSLDEIVALCDELFDAHGTMIPPMR